MFLFSSLHLSTCPRSQLIWPVLTLMLLLTLRNSCKVKQSQPMQKDVGGQVSTEHCLWLMRQHFPLRTTYSQCGWLTFFPVEGWPSWRPRHRRGEVGEQCRSQTRKGPKWWVRVSVKDLYIHSYSNEYFSYYSMNSVIYLHSEGLYCTEIR